MGRVPAHAANPFGWSTLPPAPGRLLVATPMLTDPSFARAVLYLLEHDASGSAAVILNRPSHTPVGQVLPEWQEVASDPAVVFAGGPVQPDGALCLGVLNEQGRRVIEQGQHLLGGGAAVRPIVEDMCTVDLDSEVGQIIAITGGLRVFAGHAGWSPGQLDAELAEGAWFVLPSSSEDVFATEPSWLRRDVLRRQPVPLKLMATYPLDPVLN
jgi:putative transcriptional regulator